jgi:uncharacterized protein YxeA
MKRAKLFTTVAIATILSGATLGYVGLDGAEATVQTTDDQTKSVIQQNMWNAIDSYKTAKGSYVTNSQRFGSTKVDFQVREGDKPGSYVKVTNNNGDVSETRVNGNHLMDKLNGQVVMVAPLVKGNGSGADKHMNRYQKNTDGQKSYVHRADPAVAGIANDVTFPETLAFWLEDYSKWSIEGEGTLVGRTVDIVKGELPSSIKQKHNAETFHFWVDRETGMLLKLEEYNQKGQVVEGHEVSTLKINGEFDEKLISISQEEIDKAPRSSK